MKIPQTFLPGKSLETKIKHLLKKQKKTSNRTEGCLINIDEAKQEFPKLVDYLLCSHPNLNIIRKENKGEEIEHRWTVWFFYDIERYLGSVNTYVKSINRSLSEYGYKGQILINNSWHTLDYRKGYLGMATTEDPLRRDSSKKIPFP